MFRRKPTPVNDETLRQQNESLKQEQQQLKAELRRQRELLAYFQQTAALIDTALEELFESVPALLKPTVKSMIGLNTRHLAELPNLILDQSPQAATSFLRYTGLKMEQFEDPALASTELLSYRIHTLTKLLTNLLANNNIGPSDVLYQAKNDLDVLLQNEEARQRSTNTRSTPLTRLIENT